VASIVHCASSKGDADSTQSRAGGSINGAAAAPVFISIVGVDSLSWGDTRSKLEAERVVVDSGLPWTTLRATQFSQKVAPQWGTRCR
jgi:uncharacterized protein YbjT (DUF2867 family)